MSARGALRAGTIAGVVIRRKMYLHRAELDRLYGPKGAKP